MRRAAADVEIQDTGDGDLSGVERRDMLAGDGIMRHHPRVEPVLAEELGEHARCGVVEWPAPGDAQYQSFSPLFTRRILGRQPIGCRFGLGLLGVGRNRRAVSVLAEIMDELGNRRLEALDLRWR